MSAVLSRFTEDQAVIAESLPVADWAAELRRRGLARFEASGLPTTRLEDWKYTNVRAIGRGRFEPWTTQPAAELSADAVDALAVEGLDAWRIVFVDGQWVAHLSTLPDDAGITCMNLRDMLRTAPSDEDLSDWLDYGEAGFGALNSAFLGDGISIETSAGVNIERPVCLLFLSTANDTPRAVHPRVLIRAGANSRLSVLEHYAGTDGAAGLTNVVTQVRLDTGARLEHYRLQEESDQAYHVAAVQAELGQDSCMHSHNLHTGGRLSRADIHARLTGRGAHVGLNGFYLAAGRQHTDSHTLVDHLVPHTTSDEEYRGVLTGHGRAVFNGKAVVHEGAAGTNAQQANHNLLLSEDAEVDTKPELEIYADDVKCSHGATVGALDTDALFYLQSRGIDQSAARAILTFAFADEVLRHLDQDAVRRHVEQRVLARLPKSDTIREFL